MPNLDIINNPTHFRTLFYNQVQRGVINPSYTPIINIILYLVWVGITKTLNNLPGINLNQGLYFLCLATYKSFLPIIQNIRIGYIAAALILMRSHIEQIALLGYLQENTELIPRYIKGEDLKRGALKWAKENTVANWMTFYSNYSKVVHAKLENTATSVMDESEIGVLIQKSLPNFPVDADKLTDELLAGVIYSLIALDCFNENLIGLKLFSPKIFLINPSSAITPKDLKTLQDFITHFIEKHELINSQLH